MITILLYSVLSGDHTVFVSLVELWQYLPIIGQSETEDCPGTRGSLRVQIIDIRLTLSNYGAPNIADMAINTGEKSEVVLDKRRISTFDS